MSRSVVWWGALGAVLSGSTFLSLSVASLSIPQPPASLDAVFASAWLLTVLPVTGLRAVHGGRDGVLGTVGSAALVLGAIATFVGLVTLVAGSPSLEWLALPVGGVLLFLGLVVLGVATLRARVLSRWFGVAMIAVLPLTVITGFVLGVSEGTPGDYPGVTVMGVFWLALGYRLLRSSARPRQHVAA